MTEPADRRSSGWRTAGRMGLSLLAEELRFWFVGGGIICLAVSVLAAVFLALQWNDLGSGERGFYGVAIVAGVVFALGLFAIFRRIGRTRTYRQTQDDDWVIGGRRPAK